MSQGAPGDGEVPCWTPQLQGWLQEAALRSGFDIVGVAPVSAPENDKESRDAERFQRWVDAGHAGEMEYLKRRDDQGRLLRSSVSVPMPWARSVIVCALNYNAGGPRSIESAKPTQGWIARYAWSGRRSAAMTGEDDLVAADYHDELLSRLRALEAELQANVTCQSRCYVDTGPLVERTLAERAGIGWIGKNTCTLNQTKGSWLLLGVIVTSLGMQDAEAAEPAVDRCGSCTRCLEACPTGALVAPREMDASRCIAYLTIEKKGSIAEEFRERMGRQVFGCDICQDVCPWNRRAPLLGEHGMPARSELINPELAWLAEMDAASFNRRFKASPLERTRRPRLLRNVAIAMGNSGQAEFVPTLVLWSSGEDAVLAEAASWAIAKLTEKDGTGRAGDSAEHGQEG